MTCAYLRSVGGTITRNMVNVWLDTVVASCWRHIPNIPKVRSQVFGVHLWCGLKVRGMLEATYTKKRRIISTLTKKFQIAPTWAGRSTKTMQFCETLFCCPLLHSSLLFFSLLKSTMLSIHLYSIQQTPFSLFSSPFYSSPLCPTPLHSHSSLLCSAHPFSSVHILTLICSFSWLLTCVWYGVWISFEHDMALTLSLLSLHGSCLVVVKGSSQAWGWTYCQWGIASQMAERPS